MSVRSVRMMLWGAGGALLALGGLAVVAAVRLPLRDQAASAPVVAEAGLRPGLAADLPPLSEFEPAWQVNLRRPLTDSAPAGNASAGAAAEAGPDVRLVGTILDGSRPRGVFVVGGGTAIELRAVGEKAGAAEVIRIDERSATLSYDGRTVTLKLEEVDVLGLGERPADAPPSARAATGTAGGS